MELFAGIDAGGSKTECVLTDGEGTVLGTGRGGPSNHLFVEKQAAGQAVSDSISGAFRAAGLKRRKLEGAYLGSASVATGKGARQNDFYGPFVDSVTLLCDGDLTSVWYSGARGREAVVLIAGTGAISMCFPGDTLQRLVSGTLTLPKVSGWGAVFGDEGSGYDIAVRSLRLALHMLDGRTPRDDAFCAAILRRAREGLPKDREFSDEGMILQARYLRAERSDIASLASEVTALAASGNIPARSVTDTAACELVSAACAAARHGTGRSLPVIVGGGLLKEGQPLLEALRREAAGYPVLGEVIRPACDASRACAALALACAGRNYAAERVLESAGTSA